jgi:hypothetical protein
MKSAGRGWILLTVLSLLGAGCAAPPKAGGPSKVPSAPVSRFESPYLGLRLEGVLRAGDQGTLIKDPGWREYLIEVENRGKSPLVIHDVKLLSGTGRYLPSALSYEEISAPPGVGEQVAEDIARRSAGIAAGQVVPYGGAIFGVLSGVFSASESQSDAEARRRFALRRIKDLELAPGGHASGSALLPDIEDARALVIDYSAAGRTERIEIPLREA